MRSFCFRLAGVAAILLSTAFGAAAECTGDIPQGSYRQTCFNCVKNGNTLTATCPRIKRTYNSDIKTTLVDFNKCSSDIGNADGNLTCEKGVVPRPGPVPNGSYKATCRDIAVERNNLYATCKTATGKWKQTALAHGQCKTDIYNSNGNLACNLPFGSYQRSCQNARVEGDTLIAQCKNRSGRLINTSISAKCGKDIANIDGNLRCQ